MTLRILLTVLVTLLVADVASAQDPPHRVNVDDANGNFLGSIDFIGTGPGSEPGDSGTADIIDANGDQVATGSWLIDEEGNMLLLVNGALVTFNGFYQSLNPAVQGPGGSIDGGGGATWTNPDYH